MAKLKLEYDVLREKDVRDSQFDIEIQFEAPEGFWEPDPEAPYRHPEQRHFWKGAVPKRQSEYWRVEWLDDLHMELRKRGWPAENVDAMYSYFEDPVWNPDEGEELEPDMPPAVEFRLWIPGDWLIRHPDFFMDLERLKKKGMTVRVNGKKKNFKLFYYRINVKDGELDGEAWEDSFFIVKPPREKPKAFEGGPRDWFPEEPVVS
jgi:hypothetical protein